MHLIGWSTGALLPKGNKSNYQLAIDLLKTTSFTAIEFSVLREQELPIFLENLPHLDTIGFNHISFHISKHKNLTEKEIFKKIQPVIEKGWLIVHHPDIITDFGIWKQLGSQLCIENMDGRKQDGRSVKELERYFNNLPDASMCFDIGHVKQIDPSMKLGKEICQIFGQKIKIIHLSEVDNTFYSHSPINDKSLEDFAEIINFLSGCSIILEYCPLTDLGKEVQYIVEKFPLYGIDLRF